MKLSVCQMDPSLPVPSDILEQPFTVFLRTHDEATLICPADIAPKNAKIESGWIAMEILGPFEFALTGILTQVAIPLAEAGISIYALSTFNTDYVLIKADKRNTAMTALQEAGHSFV